MKAIEKIKTGFETVTRRGRGTVANKVVTGALIAIAIGSGYAVEQGFNGLSDLRADNGLSCKRYIGGGPYGKYNGSKPGQECQIKEENLAIERGLGGFGLAVAALGGFGLVMSGSRKEGSSLS